MNWSLRWNQSGDNIVYNIDSNARMDGHVQGRMIGPSLILRLRLSVPESSCEGPTA